MKPRNAGEIPNVDIRITILIDDKASRTDLNAEHGLSLWIEYGEKRILFDTGQSDNLLGNAEKLSVDLAQTDAVVISHGHYDHTGGLSAVLDIAAKAKIYLHPAAIETKFSRKTSGAKSIGMSDSAKKAVKDRHVIWTVTPAQLFTGMAVTGQVPRINDFEDVGGNFFLDENCQKPDELLDDQSLFVESARGLIVVLGCAHAGVVNILNYVAELTNQGHIYAIIGGTHLLNASLERIERTIKAIKRYNMQQVCPAHCTGSEAVAEFRNAFAEQCAECAVGKRFEF
ncbi:MAG: MBL fold metallo-hydrolase [Sedimentisphaerales bacterium]|nr:MBL fold metallo-hydrolase [Sedimentisphaerales bacterium]